jgi:hypothetical protein
MKKKLSFIVLTLLFISSIKAQEGFRIEANVGITVGDSSELHSYALQGNLYYLWKASENINIGLTTGALVFLGDASEDFCEGCLFDDYEPELYVPIAIAGRANFSKKWSIGLDTGYAVIIHVFDSGGGFYLRPNVAYNLKEKFALIASYTNISESGYNGSTINLGVNFGF